MTGRQSTIDPQRHFHEQDPKGPLKAKLRIAATVFAFVGTIMFSYAAAKTLHLNNPYFVVVDGAFQDELPLAPVYLPLAVVPQLRVLVLLMKLQSLLSLLYNPFSVILLIHVREGRRIHPGWHIVIDFIIWGLCIPSITFAARDGWWIWWTPFNPEFDYDGIYGCAEENFFSEKCSPLIYTIGRMEITGCVCLFFIWYPSLPFPRSLTTNSSLPFPSKGPSISPYSPYPVLISTN